MRVPTANPGVGKILEAPAPCPRRHLHRTGFTRFAYFSFLILYKGHSGGTPQPRNPPNTKQNTHSKTAQKGAWSENQGAWLGLGQCLVVAWKRLGTDSTAQSRTPRVLTFYNISQNHIHIRPSCARTIHSMPFCSLFFFLTLMRTW
jgi:hypothetical protein